MIVLLGISSVLALEVQSLNSQINQSNRSQRQSGALVSYYPVSPFYPRGLDFIPKVNGIGYMAVFLAESASSDVIYVYYQLNGSVPLLLKTEVNKTADIPAGVSSSSEVYGLSHDVTVIANESSVEHTGAVVTFTISINANASGLYAIYIPHIQCQPLWLAVGFSPSEVASSNFPGLYSECLYGSPAPPASNDQGYLIAVEGLQILYAAGG